MAGYVATIGMFDGVHRGHQFVLQHVIQTARERGLQPMVITFDHSIRREQLLTTLDEKLTLIRQTDIEHIEVLPFTAELKQLTAYQFMQQVLKERLNVKVLLTGYDNRFGHNREESFNDYVRYGHELDIEVLQLPAKGQVSSSLIRQLLLKGQVTEAAEALGHPYKLKGRVEHGEHVGTRLGFPTANIVPDNAAQLIPAPGVYAVTCDALKGIMNIGTRPTFGPHSQTLEVHLLHYDGNLYGQQLSVAFIQRLRDEQRFDSVEALQRQLQRDAQQAEALLTSK
ncbi:MAG: riboflavin biosynthesis protein RibF [Prevotella sp.]|nr:riboflavin biosynthesis protein RibF [Prevotella sp.]